MFNNFRVLSNKKDFFFLFILSEEVPKKLFVEKETEENQAVTDRHQAEEATEQQRLQDQVVQRKQQRESAKATLASMKPLLGLFTA